MQYTYLPKKKRKTFVCLFTRPYVMSHREFAHPSAQESPNNEWIGGDDARNKRITMWNLLNLISGIRETETAMFRLPSILIYLCLSASASSLVHRQTRCERASDRAGAEGEKKRRRAWTTLSISIMFTHHKTDNFLFLLLFVSSFEVGYEISLECDRTWKSQVENSVKCRG